MPAYNRRHTYKILTFRAGIWFIVLSADEESVFVRVKFELPFMIDNFAETKSQKAELNRRPTLYESVALPLSYSGA